MMREGEAALRARGGDRDQARRQPGCSSMFAEDLESNDGGLLETERPAVRRALQQHRMPRDLGRRRPGGASASRSRRAASIASPRSQQVAGLLPGVARAAGAGRRAPAGQGRDADPAAERRLRLADAAGLGPRGRQAPCHRRVMSCSAPRATAWSSRIRARRACATSSSMIPTPSARCPAAPTRRPISPRRMSGRAVFLSASAGPEARAAGDYFISSGAISRAGRGRCRARRSSPPAPGSSAPA